MAEIKLAGHVVEVRRDTGEMVMVEHGSTVETTLTDIRPNDAAPGNYVWVYDDGQVEIRGAFRPGNVTERALPHMIEPQQDHS